MDSGCWKAGCRSSRSFAALELLKETSRSTRALVSTLVTHWQNIHVKLRSPKNSSHLRSWFQNMQLQFCPQRRSLFLCSGHFINTLFMPGSPKIQCEAFSDVTLIRVKLASPVGGTGSREKVNNRDRVDGTACCRDRGQVCSRYSWIPLEFFQTLFLELQQNYFSRYNVLKTWLLLRFLLCTSFKFKHSITQDNLCSETFSWRGKIMFMLMCENYYII